MTGQSNEDMRAVQELLPRVFFVPSEKRRIGEANSVIDHIQLGPLYEYLVQHIPDPKYHVNELEVFWTRVEEQSTPSAPIS